MPKQKAVEWNWLYSKPCLKHYWSEWPNLQIKHTWIPALKLHQCVMASSETSFGYGLQFPICIPQHNYYSLTIENFISGWRKCSSSYWVFTSERSHWVGNFISRLVISRIYLKGYFFSFCWNPYFYLFSLI